MGLGTEIGERKLGLLLLRLPQLNGGAWPRAEGQLGTFDFWKRTCRLDAVGRRVAVGTPTFVGPARAQFTMRSTKVNIVRTAANCDEQVRPALKKRASDGTLKVKMLDQAIAPMRGFFCKWHLRRTENNTYETICKAWIAQCVARARTWGVVFVSSSISACQTQVPVANVSADRFFGDDHSECKMTKVGEMPVSSSGGHLYIGGIVNKQHVSLVFDTGVQKTTLTQAAASRLSLSAVPGKTGKIAGIGGEVPVSLYRAHFLLNGVDGDWERYVLAGDLNGSGSGAVGDGLIGPSFFTGHDIDLDLPDQKIILYYPEHDCSRPSAFLHGPLTNVPLVHPEQTLPDEASPYAKRITAFIANLSSASPKILVSVSGKQLVAAIDSGAPRNILFLGGAQKIGIPGVEIANDKHTLAFGLGPRAVAAAEHIVRAVDVGELEVLNMPVIIVDQNNPVGIDMILGLDFIQRVHVWISYSSNSLIMQYPPGPSPLSVVKN